MKQYECVWYNGNVNPTAYELLEFDLNKIKTKEGIKKKAWEVLKQQYGFEEKDKQRVFQTLYLLDIEALERL